MSDGAQQGLTANDAMRTAIGGVDEDDLPHFTTGDMAERIMATELVPGSMTYDTMSDWVAKQIILLAQREPGAMADHIDRYKLLKASLPADEVEELTGITGFMWGWAENAARAVLELPEIPNPALITISTGNPGTDVADAVLAQALIHEKDEEE